LLIFTASNLVAQNLHIIKSTSDFASLIVVSGDIVKTIGFSSPGDGGDGTYLVKKQ